MSITEIDFQKSAELAKEIEVFSGNTDGEKLFATFKTGDDLIRYVENSSEYVDMTRIPKMFQKGRVLDVGVAYGITSAYLALNGFEVTCVEPVLKLCQDMEKNFARLGIKANIVCATGESLNHVKGDFNLVVFCSSLHHCDDVDAALSHSYSRLAGGGSIVIYEPVLKFYRTKAWFYQQLKDHPEKVGHYGGNEHIYRYGEYVAYLERAGFARIRSLPSLTYEQSAKRAPWDNTARYTIKKIYFWCVRNFILKVPGLREILMQLSLINPVIIGEKAVTEAISVRATFKKNQIRAQTAPAFIKSLSQTEK